MQTVALRTTPKCPTLHYNPSRFVSTSPYGRTHVWKRRPPVLPNPVVPKYPQTIIRSDGTSFVQWTTSPKSLIRLTRDTTNNPVWNAASWANERGLEEESGSTGRMGRFSRKFGGVTTAAPSTPPPTVEKKVAKEEKVEVKVEEVEEGVIDLTGRMNMGMGGMGGSLDDVKWFEEMAGLTGGETKAPGTGKKEKEKK